jgi:hypothetical protein
MEKLTATMQSAILARPTHTFLRSTSDAVDKNYKKILNHLPSSHKAPNEFDGRKVWAGALTPVMNQGTCGSCWAFVSTSVLADRFNIQSMGLMHVQLSASKLILCDWQGNEMKIDNPVSDVSLKTNIDLDALSSGACFGNSLFDAFRYMFVIGTCIESCMPYNKDMGVTQDYQKLGSFENVESLPLCANITGPIGDMCTDYYLDERTGVEGGTPQRFYKAFHFSVVPGTVKDGGSEARIREEIFMWGPVATGMKVYPDFYTFDPTVTIYEWNGKDESVGGHAIEIVGWGVDRATPYWIVKNSWGVKWGIDGYFRMVRGVNNCEIEENVMCVTPDFFYPENHSILVPNQVDTTSMQADRRKIATRLDIAGGGIDPITGYTRRVMARMPWLNFARPVSLNDLPDWSTFVAGRDSTVARRPASTTSHIPNETQSITVYISVVVVLILAIIGTMVVLWRNRT